MTEKRRLYLHIGTHKTGSTAFQYFLRDHARELEEEGFAFYKGEFEVENHLEFHVAAMRTDRISFSKQKYGIVGDDDFRAAVAARLAHHLDRNDGLATIISAEGLSLLRYDDEIQALRALIDADRFDVRILLVLRHPADYLEAMRRQIEKVPGRKLSTDPDSHLYVEADSWLVGYEDLRARWARAFGEENLTVLDYDDACARNDGNIIPAMLDILGVPPNIRAMSNGYRHNVDTRWAKIRRWLAKHRPF